MNVAFLHSLSILAHGLPIFMQVSFGQVVFLIEKRGLVLKANQTGKEAQIPNCYSRWLQEVTLRLLNSFLKRFT